MPKPKLIAKNHLTPVTITHVHFTKKGAQQGADIVILKAAGDYQPGENEVPIQQTFAILKSDSVKKQVFGYATGAPDQPDSHGDVLSATDIELLPVLFGKALAYGFADGPGGGSEHSKFSGAYNITSVIDIDGHIGKSHGHPTGIPGAWWVGYQVTDDQLWDKIEKKELSDFTIGGYGTRTPIAKSADNEDEEIGLVRRFMRDLTGAFRKSAGEGRTYVGPAKTFDELTGYFAKADGEAETFNEINSDQKLRDATWQLTYQLQDSLISIVRDDTVTDKKTMMGASIDQFKAALLAAVDQLAPTTTETTTTTTTTETVTKSHHDTQGDTTMAITPEELAQISKSVTDAVMEKVQPQLDEIKKSATPPAPPEKKGEGQPTEEEINKSELTPESLAAAVKKGMEPFMEEIRKNNSFQVKRPTGRQSSDDSPAGKIEKKDDAPGVIDSFSFAPKDN